MARIGHPMMMTAALSARSLARGSAVRQDALSRSRVLVIDDDRVALGLVGSILLQDGHEVCAVSSAMTGMRVFDVFRPDVVITDIVMPDMDGIELIMAVRLARVDARIIAMSGSGSCLDKLDLLEMAAKLGADDVLSKPVDRERLRVLVNSARDGKNAP
jgi:DNA-binding response OmpR family regulator